MELTARERNTPFFQHFLHEMLFSSLGLIYLQKYLKRVGPMLTKAIQLQFFVLPGHWEFKQNQKKDGNKNG